MIRDSLSILVVDDMKFSCEFIRRALTKEGYTSIEVVNNASDALVRIQEQAFDVVLADWLMPEMDGLELANKIRQLDEECYHYTGIVLLTAKDDVASIRTAFEEGVDDYLIKPPNQIELAARIYAAGRVASMQNDLLDTTRALNKYIELKCKVDRITGLGRLEETRQRLDTLLQQTQSRGGATCCGILKIIDLDEISTQHGTQVQEQLLGSIANRICRLVRPIDLVGHIDKDEFLIALYYTNAGDVRRRSFRRILYDINHRSYKTSHGFLNIHCAMAMTIIQEDNMYSDVIELITDTRERLTKSIKMGLEDIVS
jgi:PleD family two-component response regulator